ncbi:N-glycosylase/DNA lyase [Oceanivirga miroungae]|uniref:N-glycosylase/DNA lyase n=1 Tax=Oceanivirga miroungae TaxID=1130046 RepID=UPI0012E78149|nr:N-glycosylase/DNA lyase [Oceanivirga miroungae]
MKINEKLNNEILELNKKLKDELDLKIKSYKEAYHFDDEKFFKELAFCILTPQSKALNAWDIIEKISENRLLYTGDELELVDYLNTIRFKNTKAKRLVLLRELVGLEPKKVIFFTDDIFEIRRWLVENVNGMGLKEASHFLRNVGFGENIAILDRHILRVLKELNVISEIPKTLSYKIYLEIEEKMRKYSNFVSIPMDRLDLILWYRQVGYMFK